MGVAGTLVLATVVLGIIAFAAFSERGRRRRWSDTLQQLCDARPDLKRHDSPGWSRVYGSVGRFALEVRADAGRSTTIQLTTGLPETLGLRRSHSLDLRRDHQVGIERFDERFRLEERRDVAVLARLGERTRTAMWAAVDEGGVQVRGGDLVWQKEGTRDLAALTRVIGLMVELAEALCEHDGRPAEGLLHHAFEDPDPCFRRRCLDALLTSLRRAPEAEEAIARAADDPDPEIRYLAAKARGDDGLAAIRQLVDEGLPEPTRGEAVALLAPRFGGGLSVAPGGQSGAVSLEPEAAAGLSEAPRPAKQKQGS